MTRGEDQITTWFARQSALSGDRFPIGIGDDMAMLRLGKDASVLITTDMLLEGVHFDLKKAGLEQVGYKAMAVSLSDCAAMATQPIAAVVAVGLPADFSSQQLKQLHMGIVRAGQKHNCELIGGDITKFKSDGPFVINVAMLSKPAPGIEPVRRDSAQVDDCICVTGTLGGSLQGKHLEFDPRINEAVKIAKIVRLHAMMDISDGLSRDLPRICSQSGVGAIIEAGKIPLSDAAAKSNDPLAGALNDGEDFELLFTLSQSDCQKLLETWRDTPPITCIGTITENKDILIKSESGETKLLQAAGFDHLSLTMSEPGQSIIILSNSATETIDLGEQLGRQLRGGEIIALIGTLGSGKTHLIKGLAKGLDAEDPDRVNSPTFVIVNEYQGRCYVYHIDAYRIERAEEFDMLGFDDYCRPDSVVVIEWADKVIDSIKEIPLIKIDLSHKGLTQRDICIQGLPDYVQIS